MDTSDSATPLTLDDHIAFGRYYLEALKGDLPVGDRIILTRALLQPFLEAAIEALARQRDQAPKRRKGGRPPGGMGDMMVRLVDNGMPEPTALHITVQAWGKDAIAVLRAYELARRKRAAKNPPPKRRGRQKTPT